VDVVIVLARVVEHRGVLAERALDDLLERLALPFGAFERGVAVIDISQMMLVVMIFERLARHDRRQRVVGIRKIGQREGHGEAPWAVGGRNRNRGGRDKVPSGPNLAVPQRRGNSVAQLVHGMARRPRFDAGP
jgi:hypothetical protein